MKFFAWSHAHRFASPKLANLWMHVQLKEENTALMRAQEKADYRVKIMKTSLEEALGRKGESGSLQTST